MERSAGSMTLKNVYKKLLSKIQKNFNAYKFFVQSALDAHLFMQLFLSSTAIKLILINSYFPENIFMPMSWRKGESKICGYSIKTY